MTPSLAWTSKQCASFCYTQSEMGSDEVTGPWAFWPHNSAFYWQGCALLWHQEMIESGKSRFSLLGLNPWGWALEECCLFPDTHLLTLCLCFQAGIMWTAFYHHTLLDHDLLSPRVQNSNIIYPLPWTEMTEIISQNKDFLLFSCLFFLHFITAIERWLVHEWDLRTDSSSCTNGAQEKGSRFLYLFLSTI